MTLTCRFLPDSFQVICVCVCPDQTTAPLILIVLAILYGHDLRILYSWNGEIGCYLSFWSKDLIFRQQ